MPESAPRLTVVQGGRTSVLEALDQMIAESAPEGRPTLTVESHS